MQTIEALTRRWKELLPFQRTLREQTVKQLGNGSPIYFERPEPNGDFMVRWWSLHYVFTKLCHQENIDVANIHLASYIMIDDIIVSPKGIFDIDKKMAKWNKNHGDPWGTLPEHWYSEVLYAFAPSFGISMSPEDVLHIPQPIRTDNGPLKTFNKEKTIAQGNAIRENILTDFNNIVVVAQAGGSMEKRFSDQQIMQITQTVRNASSNSYIIVISDKKFLEQSIYNNLTKGHFPALSLEFREEVGNTAPSAFGDSVNKVIISTDINDICASFYAADTLITTDSFWSWLGAGAKAMREDRKGKLQYADVISLHTIANSRRFGVPGAITIDSPAFAGKDLTRDEENIAPGYITVPEYHDFFIPGSQPITVYDPRRGIYQADIDLVKAEIQRVASSTQK